MLPLAKQKQRAYNRNKTLYDQKVISKAEFEQIEADLSFCTGKL